MIDRGFHPDFPPAVVAQLTDLLHRPVSTADANVRDLRAMLWSSIDNVCLSG
jgi:exoribonuclease R